MKICFYNLFNIGDIYFSSFYIHFICSQNLDQQFYYYISLGDIFFQNIPNITRLDIYNDNLNLLILDRYNFLDKKYCDNKIIHYHNKDILFVNVWCKYKHLDHKEFTFKDTIYNFNNYIQYINNTYNCNLNFDISNYNDTHFYNKYINNYTNYLLNNNMYINNTNYDNTVFIFNYQPFSVEFDNNIFYSFINTISYSYNCILTEYISFFDDNSRFKFVERDYNIDLDDTCENLFKIWEIACKCSKVILIPSGSSFTFLHKLSQIKENQLYMFNNKNFRTILNNNIFLFTGRENLIKDVIIQ